jgi:hypothetical protein
MLLKYPLSVLIACGSVPLTDWASATPLTLGHARLSTGATSIDGVTDVPWTTSQVFTDGALGITCSAALSANDGTLRCYPTSAFPVGFTDSGCTQRVAVGVLPTPLSSFALEADDAGDPVRGFALGDPIGQGDVYYVHQTPSTCVLRGLQSGLSAYTYYAITPADSTFAPMELRNVPR